MNPLDSYYLLINFVLFFMWRESNATIIYFNCYNKKKLINILKKLTNIKLNTL